MKLQLWATAILLLFAFTLDIASVFYDFGFPCKLPDSDNISLAIIPEAVLIFLFAYSIKTEGFKQLKYSFIAIIIYLALIGILFPTWFFSGFNFFSQIESGCK
jgi:hypothetical protein